MIKLFLYLQFGTIKFTRFLKIYLLNWITNLLKNINNFYVLNRVFCLAIFYKFKREMALEWIGSLLQKSSLNVKVNFVNKKLIRLFLNKNIIY